MDVYFDSSRWNVEVCWIPYHLMTVLTSVAECVDADLKGHILTINALFSAFTESKADWEVLFVIVLLVRVLTRRLCSSHG